jgi:hypothetical protein
MTLPGFAAEISLAPRRSRGIAPARGTRAFARDAAGAIVPAQLRNGREPEPNGLPEERTTCRPCGSDGWQQCTTYLFDRPIDTFRRACTSCGPCQVIVPVLVPGQPLDPAALRFTQQCTTGGNTSMQPCSRCSTETRIDLPWPASDRCLRICCTSLDPTACSVSVRTC